MPKVPRKLVEDVRLKSRHCDDLNRIWIFENYKIGDTKKNMTYAGLSKSDDTDLLGNKYS